MSKEVSALAAIKKGCSNKELYLGLSALFLIRLKNGYKGEGNRRVVTIWRRSRVTVPNSLWIRVSLAGPRLRPVSIVQTASSICHKDEHPLQSRPKHRN